MNENKSLALIEAPELKQVEQSKAELIRATFVPMAEMLETFEKSFAGIVAESKNEITSELTARAKRLRLDIAKVRTSTEKVRKEQKEQYLRAGKAIDGVSNILQWAVSEKENKLKEIENHFYNIEAERLRLLQQERVELLSKYVDDAQDRNLSSMDDDVWSAYICAKKKEYDDRIEAEKQAELFRIEKEKVEAAERERIKQENERLKAEAIEREKRQAAERAERERLARIEAEKRSKEEAERKAKEDAERKKREADEKKQREEYERKLAAERAEREARERAEDEERRKREELERKIEAEKQAQSLREKEKRERLHNAEIQRNNRMEMMVALSEILTGNRDEADSLIDAIISGKIPHVKYEG
jgi:hypothetical protein